MLTLLIYHSQLEDSHQTKRPYEESFSGWQMDDESHKRLKHAADPLHFLDPSNRSTDGVAMPRNANFNDNWKSLMDLRRDGGSCSATNVSSIDASFMENLKNAWHRHISLLQNPEGGSRSHFSGSIVSRSNNNRDDYGHLESHSIGIENHGRRRNVAEDDDSRQHMLANYLMLKELSYRDSAQRTDQGGEHSSYPSNRYDPYLSMRRFE